MPLLHHPFRPQRLYGACVLASCREPETSLTIRHTAFVQGYTRETASPRQAAYHTIIQPDVCGDTCVPPVLGRCAALVFAPCATSDKALSVNQARQDRTGLTL